jgi:hypothetical protein
VVVAQYNPFGDLSTLPPEPAAARVMPHTRGSLIAVSYQARAHGVKRCGRRPPRAGGSAGARSSAAAMFWRGRWLAAAPADARRARARRAAGTLPRSRPCKIPPRTRLMSRAARLAPGPPLAFHTPARAPTGT